MQDIYAAYRMPIVFIIDEWDCVFREKKKILQARNNIFLRQSKKEKGSPDILFYGILNKINLYSR